MTEEVLVPTDKEALGSQKPVTNLKGLLKAHLYNPRSGDHTRRVATVSFPISKGMTVLDVLLWVNEHQDAGLAFRYSCRMGICGSCGMLINGKPSLACETQIRDIGNTVDVAPLPGFPLVRDMVADFDPFLLHHSQVKPYLIRDDRVDHEPIRIELFQTEEQLRDYYQFSMCIMCGLCDAACPIVTTDPEFLGPQALAQAYRFAADSRDQGWAERARIVDTVHGCWDCKLAGSCSAVCPKGVDPALGVQLLKREILRGRIRRKSAH
jgi:succinate dehydrogenase / fumarate reductase, iron-sulfur subunit